MQIHIFFKKDILYIQTTKNKAQLLMQICNMYKKKITQIKLNMYQTKNTKVLKVQEFFSGFKKIPPGD